MWELTFHKISIYKKSHDEWIIKEYSPHSIIIPFERVVPVAILMQGLSRKLINLKQLN